MKKSILKIALSALLVAVVLVGGTLAYLVTATDLLTNTFAVVDIDTEVEEEQGTVKAPYVVNNSNVAVYVRAYAVVSTNKGSSVPVAASDVTIHYDETHWEYNEQDGYYYYKGAVPAAVEGVGQKTAPLFNGVTVSQDLDENADFSVYVYHESIQAKPASLTSAADIAKLFN